MTPEAQRIAIAEACGIPMYEELGIHYKDGTESWGNSPEYTVQKCENYQRQGLGCELIKRPQTVEEFDPLNDLNAMHEAEKVLTAEQQDVYACVLEEMITPDFLGDQTELDPHIIMFRDIHATATQRAEAFLRTLGLWKE